MSAAAVAVFALVIPSPAGQTQHPLDVAARSSIPQCGPGPGGLRTTFATRLFDDDGAPRAQVSALTFANLTAACDNAYALVLLFGNDAGDVALPVASIGRASSGLDNCTGEPLAVPAGRIRGGAVTVAICPAAGPGSVVEVMNLVGADLSLSQIPGPMPASCEDRSFATILVGTATAEHLTGTNGDDLILGFGGDDTIEGGNGQDCVDGGAGDDHLFGGTGVDVLLGGSGSDDLDGEDGKDRLAGGEGDDHLFGANGPDWMDGGAGTDTCFGGHAPDVIDCEIQR